MALLACVMQMQAAEPASSSQMLGAPKSLTRMSMQDTHTCAQWQQQQDSIVVSCAANAFICSESCAIKNFSNMVYAM